MGEWGIALIAAGAALLGSVVTGWYTRGAGDRQAEAARHAGDRQADALLDTVRATLDDQRAARLLGNRRETYVRFVTAVESVHTAVRTGEGSPADRPELRRALAAVSLEGPPEVHRLARALAESLDDRAGLRAYAERDERFLRAAREALAERP